MLGGPVVLLAAAGSVLAAAAAGAAAAGQSPPPEGAAGDAAGVVLPDKLTVYGDSGPPGPLSDGATFNGLHVNFTGFGSVTGHPEGFLMAPAAAQSPTVTHAALMTTSDSYTAGGVVVEVSLRTEEQLRAGTPPNPWEVGWVVWDYTDNDHFYYAIVKPNGWELGKRDPAYPGGQRFLASGPSPSAAPGENVHFLVERLTVPGVGVLLRLGVDGGDVVSLVDTENPYWGGGRAGVYTEDAKVAVTHLAARHF